VSSERRPGRVDDSTLHSLDIVAQKNSAHSKQSSCRSPGSAKTTSSKFSLRLHNAEQASGLSVCLSASKTIADAAGWLFEEVLVLCRPAFIDRSIRPYSDD